jgi:DNA-binding response OmpR family regulator
MSNQKPVSQKVLLVGSNACAYLEELFVRGGWRVVKVDEGAAAVERARREALSAAVLISTGRGMDLAETALTLRDIAPLLEIIILADRKLTEGDAVLRAIPKTKILTQSELNDYLESSKRMS